MARNANFRGAVKGAGGLKYETHPMGDGSIMAIAEDADGNTSSANFDVDPSTTGEFEVTEGSLDLHPNHRALGVAPAMRRLVNTRYKH